MSRFENKEMDSIERKVFRGIIEKKLSDHDAFTDSDENKDVDRPQESADIICDDSPRNRNKQNTEVKSNQWKYNSSGIMINEIKNDFSR